MTEGRAGARLRMLAFLVVLMFGALSIRLWYLQVLASEQFAQEATQNGIRLVETPAVRGKILDDTGRHVLVDNRLSLEVTVNEQALGSEAEAVIYRLHELLHMPVGTIRAKLKDPKYYDYQPVPIAVDVSNKVAFYIGEHQKDFPGVTWQKAPVRTYPFGELAAHILGYTGQITRPELKEEVFKSYDQNDQVGQAGLERQYEKYLQGEKGVVKYRVNAAGKNLGEIGSKDPVPGNNLILNIDARDQQIAEASLKLGLQEARGTIESGTTSPLKASGGAVVVLDPSDGAVKALVSWPAFDPTVFVNGSSKQLRRLYRDSNDPLFNRATAGLYPPGSTFKPFIALSAVRNGIASLGGSYDCPASYRVPGDTSGTVFDNWSSTGFGFMAINQALIVSCDTVFYDFGYRFYTRYYPPNHRNPNEPLQRDLHQLGFGRPSGLDLPGAALGSIPDDAFFVEHHKEDPKAYPQDFMLPGQYILMAIGQGLVQVTPLQLASAYAAIANGGKLCAPQLAAEIQRPDGHVVKRIKPSCRTLPYSQTELNYVRNALTSVPTTGTAASAFTGYPFSQLPVAGKTGTAEVPGKQNYSWFAGIAPAGNPKYVVVAMVEQGGHGSTTAAPIVRHVIEGLFDLPSSPFHTGSASD